jgi:hypothetical protein
MLIGLFASYRLARGTCPTRPLYSQPNLMDPRPVVSAVELLDRITLTATKPRKTAPGCVSDGRCPIAGRRPFAASRRMTA